MNSMQRNGVILSSDIDAIRIEILKTNQALASLQADKKASLISLGKWINSDVTNETLEVPASGMETPSQPSQRPEYAMFELEKEQMEAGKSVIFSQLVPKLSAYFRGGYAKPNPFNMFATNVESFYIAGLKLQWTPFDWNTNGRHRESLEISKSVVETEKLNFDKTLDISMVKDRSDEAKFADMTASDKEIIELQAKVAETTFDKVKNGTATSTDYITQQNNLTQVRINGELHRLQSIYAKISQLLKSGKL
jgi:outer membrane protein TolC